MGDWIKAYQTELMELFKPAKERLPCYSTTRRILQITEQVYSACLARFFGIEPLAGETINDYLGALKSNQSGLLKAVIANFQPQATTQHIDKGHGRIEKRTVSISHNLEGIPDLVLARFQINKAGDIWKNLPKLLACSLLIVR